MNYDIRYKTKNKEMYEANFEIISNDNILGPINIKGELSSMEAYLKEIYNIIPFEFKYIGGLFNKLKDKKFRSYQVSVSENIVGEIYQKDKKMVCLVIMNILN